MNAIENGRFRVWSYVRPSGHSKSGGFLRGTSAPITEWAYALVDESSAPMLVYDLSSGKSGFPSAEHAVAAARQAELRARRAFRTHARSALRGIDVTYDDWKARDDRPTPEPGTWCEDCEHDECDCPCCNEPAEPKPMTQAAEKAYRRSAARDGRLAAFLLASGSSP